MSSTHPRAIGAPAGCAAPFSLHPAPTAHELGQTPPSPCAHIPPSAIRSCNQPHVPPPTMTDISCNESGNFIHLAGREGGVPVHSDSPQSKGSCHLPGRRGASASQDSSTVALLSTDLELAALRCGGLQLLSPPSPTVVAPITHPTTAVSILTSLCNHVNLNLKKKVPSPQNHLN